MEIALSTLTYHIVAIVFNPEWYLIHSCFFVQKQDIFMVGSLTSSLQFIAPFDQSGAIVAFSFNITILS